VARPVPSLLAAALAALALAGCGAGGAEDVAPLARADVLAPLRGAPPELAALHRRAGRLLPGGRATLDRELAGLRGRPVVLNLWAAWCPPCRAELPLLQREAAARGTRVAFLGVDVDDRRDRARELLDDVFLPYPSVEDPRRAVLRDLGPAGLPATVFLDREGEVVFRRQGAYPDARTLADDLDRYAR
jgi:thiol-disulfide isomerase/thioredoxin